jgi:hypothetical protein
MNADRLQRDLSHVNPQPLISGHDAPETAQAPIAAEAIPIRLRADSVPDAPKTLDDVLVLHTALAASFGDDDIIQAVRRAYFPRLERIQFGFLR